MSRKSSSAAVESPGDPETGNQVEEGTFEPTMSLDRLVESPLNPRKRFDGARMKELEESIRAKGVLTPLLVRPIADRSAFEIAAGHRRFRAAKAAGRETVPALVRSMTDAEFLEVLVIENDQREDVHPLEEAAGYQALLKMPSYDVARIAARVGRSVKYVYDRLKLLQLVPEAQALFIEGRMESGHAILIAREAPEKQKQSVGPGGGLWRHAGLFGGDDEKGKYAGLVARSVRELADWFQGHAKVDRDRVDPMLFPETAEKIERAKKAGNKIVPIMNLTVTPYDAQGRERIYSEASWKRADGEKGSKTCQQRRVLGIVSIGPGRIDAFDVCIAKEKCAVHWPERVRARQKTAKAVTAAVARGEDREAAHRKAAEEQRAAAEADRERVGEAMPAVLKAIAAAVRKASARAGGQLAKIVIEELEYNCLHAGTYLAERAGADPKKLLPLGTTAEDLIRHLAFRLTTQGFVDDIGTTAELIKQARAFGVDAKKILDQVAPVQTSAKPGKPTRGTCRKCGCTAEKACASGCGWADATETRCTACFPPTLKSRSKKGPKKAARK